MRTDVTRKFRVTDGMILVAATAVGLAVSRAITPDEMSFVRIWESATKPLNVRWSPLFIAQSTAELCTVFVVPSLVTWTLACLLLRLGKPRLPWRRLTRQPGWMACLIATSAIGITASVSVIARVSAVEKYDELAWVAQQVMIGSIQTGMAVFWCWVTMSSSGRWRPESSLIDRLSRLLGLFWLALAVVFAYANLDEFYL
jgi:hypothetical protein